MSTVLLRPAREPGRYIILSRTQARALSLKAGERVVLRCGQSAIEEVNVLVNERLPHQMAGLSIDLLRSIPLPAPIRLRLQRTADGALRIGPIVTILARSTRSRSQKFMNQTPYFAALVRTGRRLGVPTFVLTPNGVDWENRRALAWRVGSGGWTRVAIPLPDVVYDRVQTRRLDLLPLTREVKERLVAHEGIKMFNTGFLDKWETHKVLSGPETERLLPETKLLSSRSDIIDFARRHRTVYVKPAGGSLGKGIYVIQRSARGRYRVVHYGSTRVRHLRNLRTPSIVWRRLQRRIQKRRYVVQQGIAFARYRRRRFDLRLLLQKSGDGEWAVSAAYARVAPLGSLRANLDAGGKAVRCSRVLYSIFGRRGRRVLNRVLQAGLAVARAIEAATPGELGELGIDIGVDRAGRPWVIEANAKPLRQMEGPRKRLRLTLRRPLLYANRLAGF